MFLALALFVLNSTWHEKIVTVRRERCAVAIPASVIRDVMERPKEHSYCSLSRQSPMREASKRFLLVCEIKHGAAMRILIRTVSFCPTAGRHITGVVCIPSHSRKRCDAVVSYLECGIVSLYEMYIIDMRLGLYECKSK